MGKGVAKPQPLLICPANGNFGYFSEKSPQQVPFSHPQVILTFSRQQLQPLTLWRHFLTSHFIDSFRIITLSFLVIMPILSPFNSQSIPFRLDNFRFYR